MTANAFGVAIPTVTVTVRTVCYAINEHLLPDYIHMPKDVPSLERLIAAWEQKTGFPMVVGTVDGTHIPIMQPYLNSQDYYSYKMKYTTYVQSVCDYNGEFIDVDVRWPGGTHDAKVFSYSSINRLLKEQNQPYLCRTLLPGRDKVGLLLFGDPAYPLLPHVMKEYATCATDAQVLFNQMLRDARNAIECAYGRLKARWQILSVPLNFKLQEVPVIVIACLCCPIGVRSIMLELMLLLSMTKYKGIVRCSPQGQLTGGTHSLLQREERSETSLKTTSQNNPPEKFCAMDACQCKWCVI